MAWTCDHCGAVHEREPAVLRFGDLQLQEDTRRLTCGPTSVRLTGREYDLLVDLMHGRLVSKEALLMRHFDSKCSSDNGPGVYVHRLRRKLKAVGTAVQLQTHWGTGWQLVRPADQPVNTQEVVHYGDTVLNVRQRSLSCGGRHAPLRPQTTYIMEDLMRNYSAPERKLVDRYIGKSGDRIKNLRVQMTYIRRALAEIESGVEIVNTRGEGYWIRMRPAATTRGRGSGRAG